MAQVLDTLSYFFWVALALGILVFVHEMGHFLAARLFGMRVDAFSLGFAPNLFKRTIGQTEYRLGLIPLGGYVKIAGMVDESLDTDALREPELDAAGQPVLDRKGEPVYRPTPPQADEFRAKPVWQRMVVISAGVVFNLILAFLIYSALALTYGRAYTPAENVRLDVVEGSVAEEMGLRTGDRVVAVNGEPVEQFEEVFTPSTLGADPLRLTVQRGAETVDLTGPESLMTRLSQAQRDA
ncbi:MAG TPA: site-2 protease family protein, partial [Rubricoccaceae bacterium]